METKKELKDILEEIEQEFDKHINTQLKIMSELEDDVYRYGYGKSLEAYQQGKLFVKDIICNHLNDGWIPVNERLPDNAEYILLSFTNFSLPLIGRYEKDTESGAFYLGDCDEKDTCISMNLFVNAWMPLPEPYCLEVKTPERKQEWKERMLRNFLRGHDYERREDV